MNITGKIIEIGTLEDEDGSIGILVEAQGSRLITIKGLSEDQARALAPCFGESITISVAPV